jgi:nickel transport protein
MNKPAVLTLFIAMLLLMVPQRGLAHRVSVYAWHEGGKAYAEAYFADGTRCKNCTVYVLDARTGERLLEGRTDREGLFTFDTPGEAPLKVVVHAGPGHMGQYVLEGEEAPAPKEVAKAASDELEGAATFSEAEARQRIDDLTRELRRVREESQRPGLTEIVGGIGWIMGILGIAAYLKSRKK